MSVHVRLIIAVMYLFVAALFVPLAEAQSARPLKEARSANERFVLRITPGKPSARDSQKPHEGPGEPTGPGVGCRATLFERDDDARRERKLWEARFVNRVAPMLAAISDDGRFIVTLDDYGRGGAAHALVIYDERGEKRQEFDLVQLLGQDDWKHVKRRGPVLRWLTRCEHEFKASPPQFVLRLQWGKALRFDLERGEIVEGAPPLADCESVPEEIRAAMGRLGDVEGAVSRETFASVLMGLIEDHLLEHGELSDEVLQELAMQAAQLMGLDPEEDGGGEITAEMREHIQRMIAESDARANVAQQLVVQAQMQLDSAAAQGLPEEQRERLIEILRKHMQEAVTARMMEEQTRAQAEAAGVLPPELVPPAPDPANHTDYLAWLRQQTAVSDATAQQLYKSAAELATQNMTDGVAEKLQAAMNGDTAAMADPELQAYLESGRLALAQVRQATQHEYRGWPLDSDDGMVIAALLPNLGGVRQATRVGIAEARRLESEGNLQEAASIQLDLLKAGAQTGQGMTLIENLVGVAMQSVVSESLLDTMARNPGLDYTALVQQVEQKYEPLRPIGHVMQGERTMMLDMLQRVFEHDPESGTNNVSVRGVAMFQALSDGGGGDLSAMFTAMSAQRVGFEETVQRTNAHYDKLTGAAMSPFPQGHAQMRELEQQLEDPAFRAENPFMAQLVPALSRAHATATKGEMIRRGTVLATQIQAYRQQNGQYPESLEQLGSKYALDPFTNAPFAYQRLPDGSFSLYSLGENGLDDGALHDPKGKTGDWVVWPRPAKGN